MKFLIAFFALVAVASAVNTDADAPILRSTSDIDANGSFSFGYETGNGISHDASGNGDRVQGKYSYTSPEGERVDLIYSADEGGFQAQGSHIPVGPVTPPLIIRALEYIRTHPPKEV